MGRSAGTGIPIRFKCTPCRSTLNSRTGEHWEATGRSKPRSNGGKNSAHRVDSANVYEYHCLDCGHVGWSRHGDVAAACKKRNEAAARPPVGVSVAR